MGITSTSDVPLWHHNGDQLRPSLAMAISLESSQGLRLMTPTPQDLSDFHTGRRLLVHGSASLRSSATVVHQGATSTGGSESSPCAPEHTATFIFRQDGENVKDDSAFWGRSVKEALGEN